MNSLTNFFPFLLHTQRYICNYYSELLSSVTICRAGFQFHSVFGHTMLVPHYGSTKLSLLNKDTPLHSPIVLIHVHVCQVNLQYPRVYLNIDHSRKQHGAVMRCCDVCAVALESSQKCVRMCYNFNQVTISPGDHTNQNHMNIEDTIELRKQKYFCKCYYILFCITEVVIILTVLWSSTIKQ